MIVNTYHKYGHSKRSKAFMASRERTAAGQVNEDVPYEVIS